MAKYAFMRQQLGEFRPTAMSQAPGVNRSGYNAWAGSSGWPRRREDDLLRGLIKYAWLASGTVCGYRKITREPREASKSCRRHRVLRLMTAEGIRAEIGCSARPRYRSGLPGMVDYIVNRQFSPAAPIKVWITDITDVRA